MSKKNIIILGNINKVKKYLEYEKYNYHLITSEIDVSFLPKELKNSIKLYSIETANSFDVSCFENKIDLIIEIANKIFKDYGEIQSVISTNEATVVVASKIRSVLKIEKGLSSENSIFLRDKVKMKEKLRGSIPIADFAKITPENYSIVVKNFINKYKKIVVKPSNQAGSYGVKVVSDYQTALTHIKYLLNQTDEISIEQFIEGSIMHFDGIIKNGNIINFMVCRKVGTAYEYVNNNCILSTVVVLDEKVIKLAKEFSEICFNKFEIKDTVFHLEVFYHKSEFIFLEVAGRSSGGDVVKLYEYAYEFSLHKHSFLLDMNEEVPAIKENIQTNFALSLIPVPKIGQYTIKNIKGMDKLPSNIIDVNCKKIGSNNIHQFFDPFESIGQFFYTWKDKKELFDTISYIENNIKFECEEI